MKSWCRVGAFYLGLLVLNWSCDRAVAAPGDIVTAKDPAVIYEVARGFGRADMDKDGEGDPLINGRFEGLRYSIYFYGCTEYKDCADIQFAACWSDVKVPLEAVNVWNAANRFGKAYIDKDGEPCIIHPVNLNFGVTKANLEDTFEWWMVIVKDFKKNIIDSVNGAK